MSVRKREWSSPNGEKKSAWIVDYRGLSGKRHVKTFARKKEADAFSARAVVEVADGVHVADRESVNVASAARMWLETAERNGLERATVRQYQQHVDLHIIPTIGALRLSELTTPAVRDLEDRLRCGSKEDPRSRSSALTAKILTSLGSILAEAQERGLVVRNVVREMRGRRTRGKERRADRRQRGKLKVGVDIPTRHEVKAVVEALKGRWRPVFLTAVFTGLRASELRGLRWQDVDLRRKELHVRQRADRFGAIGAPKSEAGERTVPLPPLVVSTLREWRLACPRTPGDFAFPAGHGGTIDHKSLARAFDAVQVASGVVTPALDANGRRKVGRDGGAALVGRYGMHSLRHFYASWCINRRADGGLELPAKTVQARLGHASITMTFDTYGHLFPRGDDGDELAAAELALLG